MPVIAVINRKGGSGKSTLATHLAAYCAHRGHSVLMGDADFQQSSHAWLRLREKQRLAVVPRIVGWTVDPKNVLRAPTGVTHIVLDTPGGLKGYELLRVAMLADAVLMPVCYSMFDRESAAECLAELHAHPRVVRGRCRIAAVGMRLDSRTKAEESLRKWAGTMKIPYLGGLRETQTYVKCLEHGLTIFDMPAAKVETDLAQWQPILQWLRPVIEPTPQEIAAAAQQKGPRPVRPSGSPPAGSLRRPREGVEHSTGESASVAREAVERAAARTPSLDRGEHVECVGGAALDQDASATVSASDGLGGAPWVDEAATVAAATAASATTVAIVPSARRPATIDETAPALPAATPAALVAAEASGATAKPAPADERRQTVPASTSRQPPADEDLDSRFGFSTRIGRWLEMLSLRRAR